MNFHQTSEPVLSRAFGLSIHQPISCHRSVPLLLRQLRKQASQAYLSVTSVVAKPPQLSALAICTGSILLRTMQLQALDR